MDEKYISGNIRKYYNKIIATDIFSSNSSLPNKIQVFTLILFFIGLFFVEFSIVNLFIVVVFFYLYSIIGLSMTLHRYYTHKSFQMNLFFQVVCTFIAILAGRGSPLGWVYVHRMHHAYSDSDKDPHSPKNIGFRLFGFKPVDVDSKPKLFLIKDLMTKWHILINKWYILIIISWLIALSFFGFWLIYFSWVVPVLLIQISQNCFNYFAHTWGYRNFETSDRSTNNYLLWPFILGDAWHNNHHAEPMSSTTSKKWYEFDPVYYVIRLIKKNV